MKKTLIVLAVIAIVVACGQQTSDTSGQNASTQAQEEVMANDGKGIGEIKNVTLNDPLHDDMVEKGKAIYEMKCAACHKLSGARVVGPSWADLTTKRKPEWIMNMITNVEVMLEKDPEARALLEECLTRMPNQNVSIGDARDILEFMYYNDQENASE